MIPQEDTEDMSINSAEDNDVNSPKPKRRGTIAKPCIDKRRNNLEPQNNNIRRTIQKKLNPKVIDTYSPLEESIQDEEHTDTNYQVPTKTYDGLDPHWQYQRPPIPEDDLGQGINQFPTNTFPNHPNRLILQECSKLVFREVPRQTMPGASNLGMSQKMF